MGIVCSGNKESQYWNGDGTWSFGTCLWTSSGQVGLDGADADADADADAEHGVSFEFLVMRSARNRREAGAEEFVGMEGRGAIEKLPEGDAGAAAGSGVGRGVRNAAKGTFGLAAAVERQRVGTVGRLGRESVLDLRTEISQ